MSTDPAVSTPKPRYKAFVYKTSAGDGTKIAVQRGVVKDPAAMELIPSRSASSPVFVFSDETVSELYGKQFVRALRDRGYAVHEMIIPVGEEAKTLSNYAYQVVAGRFLSIVKERLDIG